MDLDRGGLGVAAGVGDDAPVVRDHGEGSGAGKRVRGTSSDVMRARRALERRFRDTRGGGSLVRGTDANLGCPRTFRQASDGSPEAVTTPRACLARIGRHARIRLPDGSNGGSVASVASHRVPSISTCRAGGDASATSAAGR